MEQNKTIAIVILSIALAITGFFLWLENKRRKALSSFTIGLSIQKRIDELNELLKGKTDASTSQCLKDEISALQSILDEYKDPKENVLGKQKCPDCVRRPLIYNSQNQVIGGGDTTGFTTSGYWNTRCCGAGL